MSPVEPAADGPCAAYDTVPENICLGEGDNGSNCLVLSPSMRESLVLWLDPTSILASDPERIDHWCDRSGRQHHAIRALDRFLAPLRALADERNVSDPSLSRSLVLEGNWMIVGLGAGPLTFPGENTSVFVAASVPRPEDLAFDPRDDKATVLFSAYGFGAYSAMLLVTFIEEAPNAYPEASLQLFPERAPHSANTYLPVYDGRFRLFGMRRSSNLLELRLNSALVATSDQLPSDPTPPSQLDVTAIGSVDLDQVSASPSRGRIGAVVAFNGALGAADTSALESFLCARLDVCAAMPVDAPGGDAGGAAP